MKLEALKFLERREIRIFVIEPDHEADRNQIIFPVIKPRTAIGLEIHRPTDRVHRKAGFMFSRIDFPDFLDA